MYKHVAKQRRLVNAKKELHLSDEDSSGNSSDSSEDHSSNSNDSDSNSNSDSDEDEEDDDSEEDEGEEREDEEDEAGEGEPELLPPPPHFPTALEATLEPIAYPEEAEEVDDEGNELLGKEMQPVCTVCPSKKLKLGKMLDVHLNSKDHLRRLSRFTTYVSSPDFPPLHSTIDARSIASLLDSTVLDRLSHQSQYGGPSLPPPTTALLSLPPPPSLKIIVNTHHEDGTPFSDYELKKQLQSNRALARANKDEKRNFLRKERKRARGVKKSKKVEKDAKEKSEARKKRKVAQEVNDGVLPSVVGVVTVEEGVVGEGEKKKNWKSKNEIKPTEEQIALRQGAKLTKREAEAARLALIIPKTEEERKAKRLAKKERQAGAAIAKKEASRIKALRVEKKKSEKKRKNKA